jgi:hypothetical protein
VFLGGTDKPIELSWIEFSIKNRTMDNVQSCDEMSTRIIKIMMFLGSKVRLVRRADNRTTVYEPTVNRPWRPIGL